MVTDRTLERRIERVFDRATGEDIAAGMGWYQHGQAIVAANAAVSGRSIAHCAAEMAHLSPRASWQTNVAAAELFARTGERLRGVMSGPFGRAVRASEATDPMQTFGDKAHKTRSFAANLAGDLSEVTVDVWICRVVGVTEQELSRVGVYARIAAAFRKVAARHGMAAAQLQAVVWVVQRGSAV